MTQERLRRIPVQRRIMLLLSDNQRHVDKFEVPEMVSQSGIAKELKLRQNHVSRAITELESGGLVFSRSSHIVGQARRKKVYFLTAKGIEENNDFVHGLGSYTVLVHTPEGELREVCFDALLSLLERQGRPHSPHKFFQAFPDASEVDLLKGADAKKALPVLHGPQNAPRTRNFYGRTGEARKLDDYITDEGVRFVSVLSIAGQGKTSFLANYINKIKDRPVHWSNIYEWTAPANLLNDWSEFFKERGRRNLFDLLGQGPPDLHNALSALIADTAGSKALLILDDFHKANKELIQMFSMLRSLVDKAGPVFIISGRRRPGFYKGSDLLVSGRFKELELGGLDLVSSKKILASRGIPEVEAETAYALTKGHPLALELYRPQVMSDGGGVVDFNVFLSDEVAKVLSTQENEVMKLASLFEQPVSASAFLIRPGMDARILDGLCEKLLLRRHNNDTFSTHDLIRGYFREGITPAEVGVLTSKAIEYYSTRSSDNDQLEYLRLLAGSKDRKRFAVAVLEGGEYLLGQGYSQVTEHIDDLTEEELNPPERVALLILRSDSALMSGKTAQAKIHLDRALALCEGILRSKTNRTERSGLILQISKIYGRSAEISRREGKLEDIIKAHRENLRLNKEYGNEQGVGKSLNNLGMAYLERGELDQALKNLEQAAGKFRGLGDLASLTLVELNIADVFIKRMDHAAAGKHLEIARDALPSRSPVLGLAHKRLGAAYMEMGRFQTASKHLQAASEHYKAAKDAVNWLAVLDMLFSCTRSRNLKDEAKGWLDATKMVLDGLGGEANGKANVSNIPYLGNRVLFAAKWEKAKLNPAIDAYLSAVKTLAAKGALAQIDTLEKEMSEDKGAVLLLLQSAVKAYRDPKDKHPTIILELKLAQQLSDMGRRAEAHTHAKTAIAEAKKIGFEKAVKKAKALLGKPKG